MMDMATQTCTCLPAQGEYEPAAEPDHDPSNPKERYLGRAERLMLSHRNNSDLLLLQDIILTEEGETLNREEVIARVIGFYNRFVHFKAG